MKGLQIIIMLGMAALVTGCSDDDGGVQPVDEFPLQREFQLEEVTQCIYVHLLDAQGNNLLDPSNPDNIIGNEVIELEWGGLTFPMYWCKDYNEIDPRALIDGGRCRTGAYNKPLLKDWTPAPTTDDYDYVLSLGKLIYCYSSDEVKSVGLKFPNRNVTITLDIKFTRKSGNVYKFQLATPGIKSTACECYNSGYMMSYTVYDLVLQDND